MKNVFTLIFIVQVGLYIWLCWAALYQRESHVPVPYIVLHIVAGLNLPVVLAGAAVLIWSSTKPVQVVWVLVAGALPIMMAIYLYILRFFPTDG